MARLAGAPAASSHLGIHVQRRRRHAASREGLQLRLPHQGRHCRRAAAGVRLFTPRSAHSTPAGSFWRPCKTGMFPCSSMPRCGTATRLDAPNAFTRHYNNRSQGGAGLCQSSSRTLHAMSASVAASWASGTLQALLRDMRDSAASPPCHPDSRWRRIHRCRRSLAAAAACRAPPL